MNLTPGYYLISNAGPDNLLDLEFIVHLYLDHSHLREDWTFERGYLGNVGALVTRDWYERILQRPESSLIDITKDQFDCLWSLWASKHLVRTK